jgi:hypothetical protein
VRKEHDEIRALRVMVEELKAEPPPELPWDTIEQRLLARIDHDASNNGRKPGRNWGDSPLSRVLGLVAAAAVIAIGVATSRDSGEAPSAPVAARADAASVAAAPVPAGARDLQKLEVGQVIEAAGAPITFARGGLCAWTLEPGSVARVRSMGDASSGVGHTMALERGTIRAEVTPRDPSEGLVEAFAVEVGGTRVAVHGTAFSVTIDGGHVVVDVEHGAVAVGPVGHVGATTGHLLVGPTRASFSLDGGRSARLLPREPARDRDPVASAKVAEELQAIDVAAQGGPIQVGAPGESPGSVPAAPVAVAHPVQPAHPVNHEPPGPSPSARPQAEPEAPAAPAQPPPLTVATVRARLDRCFRSTHEVGSSSVEMSVSSTLRLQLNPDGTVRSARFDPPLKPELVACAGTAIAGRFAEGGGNLDIPVSFKP